MIVTRIFSKETFTCPTFSIKTSLIEFVFELLLSMRPSMMNSVLQVTPHWDSHPADHSLSQFARHY